ncbi:RNA polymerase sigma-70 factor (ECF subfamily) [Nocardioides zeae]|uniref:RNA polymerase sigma-70 factor (ECF subfamily) n=2 Tax=Nocardioides zeae TaxID=1457234 RepID=A0ACC6IKQ0_9ACTN|nr:RNA polymerase sigma factor [Nocardioides zeae]MDQ1105037.1 RNA polymerase sigma-70 factor (ECF subfamily) [Nocardioides zeae]MDR6175249.1 RNA polymerase sigma-70 factor (ECF subfamily) [Nocardioides zeae]MDR6211259.1 RNA polymerase sigma-70 factor (ECF subfamily) [Nocardioides zeae]
MSDLDLAEAHRLHAGELLGFAVNALRDRGAAEECVQDTFTRAWQARATYDATRASLRTWLFAIARNAVVDHLRVRERRQRRAAAAADQVGLEARVVPLHRSPESAAVEDRLELAWALAQLSPAHRRVVVAVRLEGLTYDALSARDGVPVATLRTRMYHALRALRALLDPEGES